MMSSPWTFLRSLGGLLLAFVLCLCYALLPSHPARSTVTPSPQQSVEATVTVDTSRVLNHFRPDLALGAGVDGHDNGETARIYTSANLRAMKSAGLRSLTYRLRTELGIEAWHWNPRGTWSDPAHRQGYWRSASQNAPGIARAYGYRLPRRGSTIDQANNDGFSRIDDGNPRTFWKTNPYLDAHFTGESNSLHPAWFVVDLEHKRPLNAARLRWGAPYATNYRVSYWDGPDAFGDSTRGHWRQFPNGAVKNGHGGLARLRLSERPVVARFLRVTMTQSAGGPRTRDIRDHLGFALCEASFGLQEGLSFHDWMRHAPNQRQTRVFASSCDPWHRARDRDADTEQPGFSTLRASGLTSGLPVLVPVGVLYDTPENAVAMLRYLLKQGTMIRGVELGEEPDGQYVAPDDYAALYAQFARALHGVNPRLKLGGPSFQSTRSDVLGWPTEPRRRTWLARVLARLSDVGQRDAFSFCSFEWYPFDDVCAPPEPKRRLNPALLRAAMARMRASGLRPQEPLYLTEYGYSAFAARPEVDIDAALFDADCVGTFLSEGGAGAFFYGFEPGTLLQEKSCPRGDSWGNVLMLLADDEGRLRAPLSAFHAMRLLSQTWTQPGSARHTLYASRVTPAPQTALASFALRRPDGKWSVLLINHEARPRRVNIRFSNDAQSIGKWHSWSYGAAQYVWHGNGEQGFPARNWPPVAATTLPGELTLAPQSLCVVQMQTR